MIPANRVLVVAPHPDDEVIGCGGTAALAARRGADVQVLVVFDGGAGDPDGRFERDGYVKRRREEALRGGQLLGVSGYHFWALEEGHRPTEEELEEGALRLAELVEQLQPELILAPWEGEDHPDHESVARAVQRMVELTDFDGEVWGFEIASPFQAEHLIDVSTVWERKLQALGEHRTQLAYGDLLERTTALATRLGAGYLEGFRRLVRLEVEA
jgi:LmbE family N-acetylglucosaminyl deacetylase